MSSRWLEWIERLPVAADRPLAGYGFALGATGLGALVRVAAGLPQGYPFVSFFPAIILTAFIFGTRPGLFAGLLSWLTARYFFMEPVHSLGFAPGIMSVAILFAVVVGVDLIIIHLMQRANRLLREQREISVRRHEIRDAMFHELQHRVSNKLQIIASLLTLQKRAITDPDAQKALEDAAVRVGMIGRISRALHDPDRAGLGVAAFLDQVGRDIIAQSGAPNIEFGVEAEPGIEFASDAGVPIALILAETISNALEHGFASRGNGVIAIKVTSVEGQGLAIVVSDNGLGVAHDFDAAGSRSLGLRIATTLARQLGGTYVLRPGEPRGAVAVLEVPG
ncbi:sensor histidine kinase [soil metagenome]